MPKLESVIILGAGPAGLIISAEMESPRWFWKSRIMSEDFATHSFKMVSVLILAAIDGSQKMMN